MTIEIDRRPLWWSFTWSIFLAFVPSIVIAVRLAGLSYTLADDALIIRTGLLSKKAEHVELYRVRNVSTSTSPVAGGKVVLAMQDGSSRAVGPIKDAENVGVLTRTAVNSARSSRNVHTRENL